MKYYLPTVFLGKCHVLRAMWLTGSIRTPFPSDLAINTSVFLHQRPLKSSKAIINSGCSSTDTLVDLIDGNGSQFNQGGVAYIFHSCSYVNFNIKRSLIVKILSIHVYFFFKLRLCQISLLTMFNLLVFKRVIIWDRITLWWIYYPTVYVSAPYFH
jgi:hypothetical protein